MSIMDFIQEFADYDICNDTTRYRMDIKIDGNLVVLSHVFGRESDTRGFYSIRNMFIAEMETKASKAQTIEKPHSLSNLPFADIAKMYLRYPS